MQVQRFICWKGAGLMLGLLVVVLAMAAGCTQSPVTVTTSAPAQTVTTTIAPSSAPTAAAQGASTGTLSGKITNSLTKSGVSGAKVVTDPAIPNQNITTDGSGSFSASLPVGVYKLSISGAGYTAGTDNVSIVAGQTATKNVTLIPASKVAVSAGAVQTSKPEATVTLKAAATPLDGSTVKSYLWTQVSGPKAVISGDKTETLTVTLPKASAYKAALLGNLEMLDRLTVKGINPEALISAQTTTFKVTVTTSSGDYSANGVVTASLPYDFTTGLANVPIGLPVLLNGKVQNTYSWTLTAPTGSKAALDEPNSRNPFFTPDVGGKYSMVEAVSKGTLDVWAGTWAGAITGQDAKGLPLADGCTPCHDGKTASNNFADWRKSGHAQILTRNINNPDGHWTLACAECHSVGDSAVATVNNGGFDEAIAAENWKAPAHGDPANWADMLAKAPKSAKLANIQCENCHGPNSTSLHANKSLDAARISISADVCGACHGEPPRHGRFQQWELAGHGNYELAIDEATVENRGATAGHCGRCHAGQGFLNWIQQGDLTKQIQGKNGNATVAELTAMGLTKDTVQPQTCTVCHDPHAQGVGSVNATIRISGDTSLLPSGYKATNVGKGALCITCHNTRNGLHNDSNPPANYSAPHAAAQGDILMGQNAYYVNVRRSAHANLDDTCVTCHMELTPAPKEYSMNGANPNHEFGADIKVCAKCHAKQLDGEAFKEGNEAKIAQLGQALSAYLLRKLPANVTVMDYTPHAFNNKNYDLKSDPIVLAKDNIASVEPTEPHGQQGYLVTLKTALTLTYRPSGEQPHTMTVKTITVQLGDFTTDGKTTVLSATDNIVKSGWNYFLVHGDSSGGIHNPGFVNDVIDASINALK